MHEPLYELYPVGRPAQSTESGPVIGGVDYTGAPAWAVGLSNEQFEAFQPPTLVDEVASAARVFETVTDVAFEGDAAPTTPTFLDRIKRWFGGAA